MENQPSGVTGVPNPENRTGAGSLLRRVGSRENRWGPPRTEPASNVTGDVAADAAIVTALDCVGTSHSCGTPVGGSGSVSGLGTSGASDTAAEAASRGSRKKASGAPVALWIFTLKVCVDPRASIVLALFASPPELTLTPELNRIWPENGSEISLPTTGG